MWISWATFGEAVWLDLRFALRSFRRTPGFILTAIGALALGMGANTAIFSLVSGVLLRPLPFSDPARLVQVNQVDAQNTAGPVSYPLLANWRKQSRSFDGMIAFGNTSKNLLSGGHPERLAAVWSECSLFQVLGVQAMAGRTFRDDDPLDVAVISAGLWSRRFAGERWMIGRKIVLDGSPFTVIGVMPEAFQFPYRTSHADIWIPWTVPAQYAHNPGYRVDTVVARLRPGTDIRTARHELGVISGRRTGAAITPLTEVILGPARPALVTLLAAVGVVLLIACANVMNLLLARAAGRTHELALRSAVGASRRRLMQQLLTESLLMSTAGAAAGLLLAWLSRNLLLKLAASRIPRAWDIGFDWRVFCFLLVVGLGTGILFGLLPALAASRLGVQSGLKRSGRRLRDSLMIAEIALAFVLLMGTAVLLRAFLRLQSTPAGFVPDHVLTIHLTVSPAEFADARAYGRYLHDVKTRIDAMPGIQAAGFIQFLPLQNWGWTGGFSILGQSVFRPGQEPQAELRYVTPDYFRAMGIPIRSGRAFTEQDTNDSPRVILINEILARRYFPNQDPVGQRTDRGTIVGVVGDVRQSGVDRPAIPEVYYTFAQNTAATPEAGVSLVLRTGTQPEAMISAVRTAIREVNPNQALFDIKTMKQVITESFGGLNLYLPLVGIFAGLALVLAVCGIYGMISYTVTGQTREFAIRLALGSSRQRIMQLVLGHGLALASIGLLIGAAGAFMLSRVLQSVVPGVRSPDLLTLVLSAVLLAAAALTACLMPARRATRVDPNTALRSE